jgi:outer membrane protein OmpA-like peptidoglycan-associated protein
LGSPDAKKKLSIERVRRIREYLEDYGIERERVEIVGYGGSKPVAPNNIEENRAKNRRVEIRILEVDT